MKHSFEIEINVPRACVIELFDNPDNLVKWQPDLIKFEHLSGVRGQPGAKSRLLYRMGKGEFEMIETVTVRDLPGEFSGTYETKMGKTWIRNRFVDNGSSTRWLVDTDYIASGLMKVMALFMKGMIRKQTFGVLQQFKAFAESAGR